MNQHHPSIKVKWELKQDTIDILDTTTYKYEEMGRLDVRVFLRTLIHMPCCTKGAITIHMFLRG